MSASGHSPSSNGSYLRLDGIGKSFGGVAAVQGLTLDVARGEFISLLGPSGCGKTTTLHMIAGFVEPDAGDIVLDGRSLAAVPSHRRGAAMVFQNYALFPHMTVFDNVAFGLRMARLGKRDIQQRVARILELVRLPALSKRYPQELSGGQQQRVALARALVLEPRLLLLDEPLSNLDAKLRRELRQDFTEIHRLTGMTTILVTHDLEEAFSTSDRVAILGHGELQQFDTPRAIYTRPATRFVAEFVGHRNELQGRVAHRAADTCLALQIGDTTLAVPAGSAPTGSASYTIPEHAISLSVPVPAPLAGTNTVEAELLNLEYLGSSVRFLVRALGTELRGERPAGPWMDALSTGRRLHASWSSDDMIALPPP